MYPPPELSHDERQVLYLFSKIWRNVHRAGMTGAGFSLNLADAESACRALGMDWDEYVLEKLLACADEVLAYERSTRDDGAKAQQTKRPEIPD